MRNRIMAAVAALLILGGGFGPANAVLRFNEDSAHTSADQGIQVLTVRKDTPASTAGTDGDYASLVTDSFGRLVMASVIKATDGVSPLSVLSATATGTTTLTAAATLFNLSVSDQHATTDFWVKIYDKATAATQADTPVQRIFVNAQDLKNIEFPRGLALANGLSIRCVSEAADSGTTAAGSNECTVNGTYK